ncbi:hypothetical protein E2C01_020803 [Portunus trituberculatus]|uniref:Uncharacterized protein n=1 Tax=Portunus trituberculatus TaxID=210409 RepID=A0A5B7E1J9_PORTR|nr:hypothetical protein [Portunus trituberculatus]
MMAVNRRNSFPMLTEQRIANTKWLKGTLTLHSDRFGEKSDVTRELRGSPCGHQKSAKFGLKLPSSVVCGHPTAKSESRQAEIRQVQGPTHSQGNLKQHN